MYWETTEGLSVTMTGPDYIPESLLLHRRKWLVRTEHGAERDARLPWAWAVPAGMETNPRNIQGRETMIKRAK